MIYKIVSCLSIITVSAYETDRNAKHAISSQMFHREDVPLSYEFHNIHNYKPRHRLEDDHKGNLPHPDGVRYHTIQYAPLEQAKRSGHKDSKETNFEDPTPLLPRLNKENVNHHTLTLEDKPKYDLEPKPLKEDDNVHQQNYRSFVSGHNVEIHPHTTGQYYHIDPFRTAQLNSEKSKPKPPRVVYYQKTSTEALDTTPEHVTIEFQKPSVDFKLHQFAPADKVKSIETNHPVQNVLLHNAIIPPQNNQPVKNAHVYEQMLHNQLFKEKQQQTFQHPRIHLNIGRIYSIANQLQETQFPPILLPKSHQKPKNGKPIPTLNLAHSVPANILGKHETFTAALKSLPNLPEKQTKPLYTPFIPAPPSNVEKIPNLSAAFYLQKHQDNTLMLPIRNTHN